ncbi:MAG TPA: Rv3654c family TadE-like protein [Acidimicrobiia bacterium]|nr:Rv3654c family TadE-like protein [Acidimicrobiia bacterium]
MNRARSQRGSVAILVCGLIALATVLAVAVVLVGGAVVLAGRAEAAADAAALAGADSVALGTRSLACAAASLVAESNEAHLVDCDVSHDSVEVVVQLTGDGPLALGRTVRARSRAEISDRPAVGGG